MNTRIDTSTFSRTYQPREVQSLLPIRPGLHGGRDLALIARDAGVVLAQQTLQLVSSRPFTDTKFFAQSEVCIDCGHSLLPQRGVPLGRCSIKDDVIRAILPSLRGRPALGGRAGLILFSLSVQSVDFLYRLGVLLVGAVRQ